jgi:hypothetical protein
MPRQHVARAFLTLFAILLLAACGFIDDEWDDDEGDWEGDDAAESQAIPQGGVVATPVPIAPVPAGEQVQMTKWDLWASSATTLRGANIHQRLVYPDLDGDDYMGPGSVGPPFTQQDFYDLAALGANWVNISHPGLYTEASPFEPNPDTVANLDNLLEMIQAADMFAVISFRTGPGRSEFTFYDPWYPASYLNETVWEDQAAQEGWVAMWQYTAERYQDSPIVVGYDLMVEPNADYVCCGIEGEPDEFYPEHAGAIYDWNMFYPHIIDGIRAVDPDMPVIVGGMGMSHVSYLSHIEPVDDARTVYAIHQYEPIDYTHQEPGPLGRLPKEYPDEYDTNWDNEPDTIDKTWLDALLWPVDNYMAEHGVPVTANEFGPMRFQPGAAQFIDDQMAVFEDRGINHALWEWGPAWKPLRDDQQEFAFRLGTDPTAYTEDASSDLQNMIASYWARNVYRPSNVSFVPAP